MGLTIKIKEGELRDKHGRRGKKEICPHCGKELIVILSKKTTSYCNSFCYQQHLKIIKPTGLNVSCACCGKNFVKHKIDKYKKTTVFYCSIGCNNRGRHLLQNKLSTKTSEDDRAFKEFLQKPCSSCSESKTYLLDVHHIDGNRLNNNLNNLERVCGNCHKKRHLQWNEKQQKWLFTPRALTPRDKIHLF